MSEAVAIVEGMSSSIGTRMPSAPAGPVTHAHYRREPYVRCRTGNGTVDAKAVAWTRTEVLLHWIDDDGQAHNRWTPAPTVRRIARDESVWRDPYDDFRFYYQASLAAA
ncbi:hypothetical protein N2K95_14540 [Arthrobacter zhaoxinii]|uniref:Uncharacterized protein n=1 Tax=Arthrobacter zhaoxinii TaxID=2964616 RepID=A0ABY5YRA4_9MICC|nr:hypothetical protein [Arthrobacter zhaoxinii]UWX96839.1 hypothetical protein N2K95_14540 [Arthrobacter zhaoxinii]